MNAVESWRIRSAGMNREQRLEMLLVQLMAWLRTYRIAEREPLKGTLELCDQEIERRD